MRAFTGKMGLLVHRSRVRALVWLVIALVTLLALSAASATGARPRRAGGDCSWGASSVRAQVVDGRIVVGTPSVSGCVPK